MLFNRKYCKTDKLAILIPKLVTFIYLAALNFLNFFYGIYGELYLRIMK